MFTQLIEMLMELPKLDAIVARAVAARERGGIFRRALDASGIDVDVAPEELARIPRVGPVIVVANHPTGFTEGLVVPALLDAVRDDGKALAHGFFRRWPDLAERMFLVDPQARGSERSGNARGAAAAARWLRRGASLVMFPAAEVARPPRPFAAPEELPWHVGLAHLVKLSGATVVPVHVSGRSGRLHRMLSSLHPRLGVLALAREILRQRGGTVTVRIGRPLTATRLLADTPAEVLTDRCREAVLDLAKDAPENVALAAQCAMS